ncbi:MAG: glycogen synthase [Acidobacteria bacterium]|nr:MAG: glycogen synthase [Acidobacteriota bacterium]
MLRIAFLASELTPFAKTGGLADVAEALPRTLGKLGHDVRVFVPLYGSIDFAAHGLERVEVSTEGFALRKGVLPRSRVPVYFIDAPRFFAREAIYTNDEDEPFRFLFFCRAVIEACQHLAFPPEVFHLNDWQTALVPLLLKKARLFDSAKTLLTIHNLAYQGVFSADVANAIGARESKDGIVNFLETGLVHADLLSTVSPTYAEEIQTPEQGYGLDALLRRRRDELVGILNGVDYETWSPAKDTLIPFRYTEKNLDGKEQNKKALLKELSLSQLEDVPLVGMVTRLSAQKGLDLLVEALPELLSRESFTLVLLGTGEAPYEEFFASLQEHYPDRVCFYRGFHNPLAHWIEAAADMFLMPSRYEPCGLNQMYSLKYGTAPIVRKTGGLADSVKLFDPATGEGTGIVFEHFTADGLRWALGTALELYRDRPSWRRLVANGMAQDFSWERQAEAYVAIYRRLLQD